MYSISSTFKFNVLKKPKKTQPFACERTPVCILKLVRKIHLQSRAQINRQTCFSAWKLNFCRKTVGCLSKLRKFLTKSARRVIKMCHEPLAFVREIDKLTKYANYSINLFISIRKKSKKISSVRVEKNLSASESSQNVTTK